MALMFPGVLQGNLLDVIYKFYDSEASTDIAKNNFRNVRNHSGRFLNSELTI